MAKNYKAFTFKMHDLVSDVDNFSRRRAQERLEIKTKLA